MASSRYNNNNNGNNGNGRNGRDETKFCAVCHAAGRPGYDDHFVRADKFDRSSAITCPYLKSIECRICGMTGHTSSYCKASRASSIAAAAAPAAPAPHPTSLARVRLPPISSSSYSKQPPRIVFPGLEKEQQEKDYPQLLPNRKSKSSTSLPPPLPLSFGSLFQNDEPLLKRGPPEASPVHSPAAPSNKVVYNKRGNAFADLASSSSSDDEKESSSPIHSPAAVGRYRATTNRHPVSWASLVAPVVAPVAPVLKPKPRVIAPPRLEPLLPPLAFKPRKVVASAGGASAVPKDDKKRLWGDSDSEDDEEFLKRGLE
jgi:hypothetical protein